MSGLVFGCIAPHGDIVIPELYENTPPSVVRLTRAMKEAGGQMEAARPDTIVVLTPHGIRVHGAVCVMLTEWASGALETEDESRSIQVKMGCDVDFARRLAERASGEHRVPIATSVYGSAVGESSVTPLDWGALVPLWFMGARWATAPKIVVVTPERAVTLRQLYYFGVAIAEVAQEQEKRVALIASADWGHAHQTEGPYGYDPASAQFDAMTVDILRSDMLDQFLDVDTGFAAKAKVDGLWQAITLAGAIHHTPLRGEFLGYEVPSYFGMMVATYRLEPTVDET